MSLDLKGPAGLSEPVTGNEQLVDYFRSAEKPRSEWKVGVEHEKIGIVDASFEPVPYYGERGIRAVLDALARDAGGSQHSHLENGQPIAVLKDGASVTLEPGGQLELSGVPHRGLSAARKEIEQHLLVLRRVSQKLGVKWLATGYRPFGSRDHVPWMSGEVGDGGVAVLRALKAELDPAGIMNPGKLLP